MKLLHGVGTKRINGRLDSYGMFYCDGCGKEVERPLANGRRNKTCGCRVEKKQEVKRVCMRCHKDYQQVIGGGVINDSRVYCPKCARYERYGRRKNGLVFNNV